MCSSLCKPGSVSLRNACTPGWRPRHQLGAVCALQSAILGFGAFRLLEKYGVGHGLSIAENVILQTTAVATAAMPLAAGLVSQGLRSTKY